MARSVCEQHEVRLALLKQEAEHAKEERKMIAERVETLSEEIRQLTLTMARYKGMVGVAMIAGTLILAGIKFAISLVWK